jgi:hypothetical protein
MAALPLGHRREPFAGLVGLPSILSTTPSSDTNTRVLQQNKHILQDVLSHFPVLREF